MNNIIVSYLFYSILSLPQNVSIHIYSYNIDKPSQKPYLLNLKVFCSTFLSKKKIVTFYPKVLPLWIRIFSI